MAVEDYAADHPGGRYLVEFADGESYRCRFVDAYDSENGCELDIDVDHPLYDEGSAARSGDSFGHAA